MSTSTSLQDSSGSFSPPLHGHLRFLTHPPPSVCVKRCVSGLLGHLFSSQRFLGRLSASPHVFPAASNWAEGFRSQNACIHSHHPSQIGCPNDSHQPCSQQSLPPLAVSRRLFSITPRLCYLDQLVSCQEVRANLDKAPVKPYKSLHQTSAGLLMLNGL